MLIRLDKNHPTPLYQQIIDQIEQAIVDGQLLPGEKLPSERNMGELFGVNRSTIVRAMDELHDRNIVIRKVGSGTYVNSQKWGLFSEQRVRWNKLSIETSFQKTSQYNLMNGDLPIELYPKLQLPAIDWQVLLDAEQEHKVMKIGLLGLRQSIQKHLLKSYDWQVDLDEILITSGTQQAISLITVGLLKSGDSIAIENPSYFYSLSIFQAHGIRIYGIPMDRDGIMIDKLDELVRKQSIKMVFINPIFHNPTGNVMSELRKKALLTYCEKKNIFIIEDDAYSRLPFHAHIDNTPLKKLDHKDNSIYLGSLSKYLGRSVRIGWMIAPKAMIEHIASIRQQVDSGLSSLPQFMAEVYFNDYADKHEKFLQESLKARCENLQHWLTTHFSDLLQFEKPLGGFHLYATKNSAQISHKSIEDRFDQYSMSITPSSYFGSDQNAYRLCFAHFSIPKDKENKEA